MTVMMVVVIVVGMINRNQIHRAVAYPGFGAEFFGETAHCFGRAAQKQRLQTIVVIQMHVAGAHHQIVGVMLQMSQAVSQVTLMVIEYIRQAGDAVAGLIGI